MRNIVLEGIDNSGKTTLATYIARAIHWPVKEREGIPPTWQQLLAKCERYLDLENKIIDRHPVISQSIYGQVIRNDPTLPEYLLSEFRKQDNLYIYCRCVDKRLEGHELKEGQTGILDTAKHIGKLQLLYDELLEGYDQWAVRCANIIYTNYSQVDSIITMVRGLANERQRY